LSLTPNIQLQGATTDLINGGARRDDNLFHSFTQFNISDGQRVYFANPSGVVNILTRVTGGQASNILGTLGVDGAANLFLMNPNGILFGKNATLDVRGSFVGTTANAIQFGNQGFAGSVWFSRISSSASAAGNNSDDTGIGNAGDIRITTGTLLLKDGGNISAFNGGQGSGGNIILDVANITTFDGFALNTGSLSLVNGGQLNASIFGKGEAGSIIINARDAVDINGVGSNGNSGIFSVVGATGVGKGGDITIQSEKLSVLNAFIASSGAGLGNAGDININTDSVLLDAGAIGADTNSTNGGNINLTAKDSLILRRGGNITTSAGFARAGGDGGNINIDARFIVAVPNENSKILANAFSGKGGSVNIKTQGIFGIEARPEPTDTSDITASSEIGVQGQVIIQEPNIQPEQGLVELPTQLVDVSNQMSQICPRGAYAKRPLGEFIVIIFPKHEVRLNFCIKKILITRW
jgi:filamentous hemagglutinin family protein